MLRKEVDQYTKLTGEDGWHVPIMVIGAYLDGYDKGLEVLDKIRAEVVHLHDWTFKREEILRIIDKYKAESEGVEE